MSIFENIKSVLSEQVIGYRTLIDILRQERECLVCFNPAGVESLSREKDTIVLKLKLLEEERVRLVRAFAGRPRGSRKSQRFRNSVSSPAMIPFSACDCN